MTSFRKKLRTDGRTKKKQCRWVQKCNGGSIPVNSPINYKRTGYIYVGESPFARTPPLGGDSLLRGFGLLEILLIWKSFDFLKEVKSKNQLTRPRCTVPFSRINRPHSIHIHCWVLADHHIRGTETRERWSLVWNLWLSLQEIKNLVRLWQKSIWKTRNLESRKNNIQVMSPSVIPINKVEINQKTGTSKLPENGINILPRLKGVQTTRPRALGTLHSPTKTH